MDRPPTKEKEKGDERTKKGKCTRCIEEHRGDEKDSEDGGPSTRPSVKIQGGKYRRLTLPLELSHHQEKGHTDAQNPKSYTVNENIDQRSSATPKSRTIKQPHTTARRIG